MKKIKLITLGLTTSLAITSGTSIALTNTLLDRNSIDITTTSKNSLEEQYPLNKAQSNGQNSFLSTKNGPLVYWKDTITALDWFGSKIWDINIQEHISVTANGGDWKRAWYNWDYDRERNILWVLGYGYAQQKYQKVFSINADTGKIINTYEITEKESKYKFITALSSGNVMVYGGASYGTYDGSAILIDSVTKESKKIHGNSGDANRIPYFDKSKSKMYLFNIFSIGKNKNIVEYVNYVNKTGVSGDNGAKDATYKVYFALVDDNLNMISNNPNDSWYKGVEVVNGVEGYRNSKITPQRDYYFLLDGRVVTILYNTVVIINPKDTSANNGVSFQKYNLDPKKWVLSWTFDNQENLFFKYKDDSTIYKVNSSELQRIDSNSSGISVPRITYYDLKSAKQEVSKYANDYVLYNVYGYSGQIMLINASYDDLIDNNKAPSDQTAKDKQYGLAVAVTQNKGNPESGDSKGCLNGPTSFQRAATFNVKEDSLKTKLPSEITRNDIEIQNGGFFTTNNAVDEHNQLKYPPFKLENIDDKKGTFKVVAYIDQIPWFATTLPRDATPKQIEMVYGSDKSAAKIENKVSWKKQEDLSYDFKNMTPSEVNENDLNELDPFQVSFNSRTVIDSAGKQQYPKKTYSIKQTQNNEGTIVVGVTYEYMPVSNEVTTLQTYESQFKYNIFRNDQQKELYFAGSESQAQQNSIKDININEVPQLKSLSQANLLPSSFSGNNKNDFLQFINTNKSKGYPISRMSFSVEPNDIDGSLVVTANASGKTFKQKYVGFNKSNEYNFQFKQANTIDGKAFNAMLPSSINEGDIIDNLVQYKGFNSSDFTIVLSPNDINGTLSVRIELNRKYAYSLGNNNGFKNYITTQEFSGFMTTEQYNSKYNLTFRDDGDQNLVEIKKLMLSTIDNGIKSDNGLTINSVKYTNLNDLVERLFVKSHGTNIPTDWANQTTKIQTKMAFDNQAGTMNLSISIDKSLLDGYDSNLNYVISYSGFTKGNIDVTPDTLSFLDNNLLDAVLPDVKKMKPSQFAEWLKTKDNLMKIIFNKTGQYVEFLQNENYDLEVDPNDNYGTVTVTIRFTKELTNPLSLKEYSVQYNLYK